MGVRSGDGHCFALPPSLGAGPVRELARSFADVLFEAGFATVVPLKSYDLLEQALLAGEVDAAWGPPLVCARVEAAGGEVALRAIRYGASSYRAVLVCRSHDDLDLGSLGHPGARRPRAAWVDRWSMAGYVLPRHLLRERGLEPATALAGEQLLGSYTACFEAVLEGDADLTASFASRRGIGYVELCGDRAFQLRSVAYSAESPNDGVILSPRLSAERRQALVAGLEALMTTPHRLEVLTSVFDVDGFDVPPPGHYAPLLRLAPRS